MNCSKKSLKKKGCALRREKSIYEPQVNLGSSDFLETRCRPYHSYSESGTRVYEVSHSSKLESGPRFLQIIVVGVTWRQWFRNKLRQCVVTLIMKTVSINKFAQDGARDFSDEELSQQVLEGSTMNRIECCKDKDGVICYLRAIQGHSGGIAVDPNLMRYFLISQHWKKYLYLKGRSWDSQICIGIWIDSSRKGERYSSSGCFPDTDKSFWKRPRGRKSSWWSHSATESSFYNILETNSKCSILGTIVRSGGSWIGILADEVVCNHDLRNNTWRLHRSCDIRRWRLRTFRTTWNSKATAQGNVEQELSMPAAAAFHFGHRRTKLLGTKAEKRGLTWSSRRFETHRWSGPRTRQLGAICFYNGWDSHCCRRHYEYISKWGRE